MSIDVLTTNSFPWSLRTPLDPQASSFNAYSHTFILLRYNPRRVRASCATLLQDSRLRASDLQFCLSRLVRTVRLSRTVYPSLMVSVCDGLCDDFERSGCRPPALDVHCRTHRMRVDLTSSLSVIPHALEYGCLHLTLPFREHLVRSMSL